MEWDNNNDGFLDSPLNKSLIALNRWKYIGHDGLRIQFGIKGIYIDNIGGQTDNTVPESNVSQDKWEMNLNMQRIEGWAKIGYVDAAAPWRSFAIQLSGAGHEQDSHFGLNEYDAGQNTFYSNALYQGIIGNTNHKFRTGISFQYDSYEENLNDTIFKRTEYVPGAYFEYTFSREHKFNAVAGIRADYHNLFGLLFTPRLHLRYELAEKTVLRASSGRSYRTANILSDNNGLLTSSREIIILGNNSDKPYGLEQEAAWNYGVNLTHKFRLDYRDGSISFDFYRTDFQNQVVADLDQSPQTVVFYNLNGRSFSNSFQAQIDYELIKRFDIRLAYRWYDVKTTYNGKLMEKPLIASNRAFINLAYETRNHWKFDYTVNWQGDKRIPFTGSNPEEYRLPERAPDFVLMNAQISKSWNEKLEIYAGAENLLDFRQSHPILASDDPFSEYFDSSMIWGPIFGRNFYMGLRYRIK